MTSSGRFRLLLSRRIYDEIVAHAQAELPNECVGLLAGRITSSPNQSELKRVEHRYPLVNALESPTEYESAGQGILAAMRDMRDSKMDHVAIYHSHPASHPVPSKKDLERNFYGDSVIHFIVSLAGPIPEMRAWWLRESEYEPAEWLVIDP